MVGWIVSIKRANPVGYGPPHGVFVQLGIRHAADRYRRHRHLRPTLYDVRKTFVLFLIEVSRNVDVGVGIFTRVVSGGAPRHTGGTPCTTLAEIDATGQNEGCDSSESYCYNII